MHCKRILTLCDFSASGNRAMERAALLAAEQAAELWVVCAPLSREHGPPDAHDRLERIARQLAQRHGLRVRTEIDVRQPDPVALSHRADLLVLGYRREPWLMCWLYGHSLARMADRSACPLLVVKRQPKRAYRRLMVALDLAEARSELPDISCSLAPQAHIELFHVLGSFNEVALRGTDSRHPLIDAYRRELRSRAQQRLLQISDSLDGRRNRVLATLGRGDTASQLLVHQQRSGAELMVLGGAGPRSWLGGLPSVRGRLLAEAGCDLLLMPPGGGQEKTAGHALARLRSWCQDLARS
ncbi:universal stress protein [Paucibacter sp. O1-1]|uniref:universal stress protein n=1 Tax=Paucibacter sp. M5-1 TaxID=3015998 RepID=UPI0021D500E8|nr:universal stress protein [Paucibacter sp. M5-1]MCU7373283.1 universal stress protein [Paucibacter sp. O1-1]MCZ7879577.1 universal stress protein [Paucibacter sp. M5-1]MDA3828282.1 universal stress protein [Paucibacter sp. O1-1]